MAIETQTAVVLDPVARQLADQTSTPPFLYDLEPEQARKASMTSS
jgi:hypothetical protein